MHQKAGATKCNGGTPLGLRLWNTTQPGREHCVQAIGRQPRRAPTDGAPVHYERHRPEQTTLYRLEQQHAATFFSEAGAAGGAMGEKKGV